MSPARASWSRTQFGILQDVQIDWDWQTKELWGQFQFPVDIARGQGKITGKAKFARIFGAIYGDLFFGAGRRRPASVDGVGERGGERAGDDPLYTVTVATTRRASPTISASSTPAAPMPASASPG